MTCERIRMMAAAVATAVVLITGLAAAAPASASSGYGSVTGTFCGAKGTFETSVGVPEINWIVDTEGRANSAHNGGCFGISPGHHIFWTERTNPRWQVMPGDGIAVQVGITYLGNACTGTCLAYVAPTVSVKTAAGTTFAQTQRFNDPHHWSGHWSRSRR